MVFRVADIPTGGLHLASDSQTAGRNFSYEADGGIKIVVLGSDHSFIGFTSYFHSIEDRLAEGRLDPCPTGISISKHAVSGLLTGTATKYCWSKRTIGKWFAPTVPHLGDIEILIYKDQQITKIVWNVFVANYPKSVVVENLPLPDSDIKQYRLPIYYPGDDVIVPDEAPENKPNIGYEPLRAEGQHQGKIPIYYPGDSVVVVKDTPPAATPNVAIMPTIRTEIVAPKPCGNNHISGKFVGSGGSEPLP
jgi:hypothetical protein